ncbi:MAG: glycosyltransferase family 4 protein [Fulvivirga sp.]
MRVLIIGNGAIGIDDDKRFFINSHTGKFLLNLQKEHEISFVQYASKYNVNNDLQNFDLKANNIFFDIIYNNKSFKSILKIVQLVRNNEVIYLFYPGTLSRIVGIIAILLRKKIGLYIRGQYFNEQWIDKLILLNSHFILTVSPHFMKSLKEYCNKVEVIAPMISITRKDFYLGRKYERPKKWNLLFVGRVEERKGIYELLEIAKVLKQNKLEFTLNIVGGGDLFAVINNLIKKEKLDNITLHGQVADKSLLKNLYNQADAFVFTSHDEGFPRVLYEAMASGLPIFTTFVGGIPGRMEDRINCVKIPVKNGKDSAAIIDKSLKEVEILKKVGINGQNILLNVLEEYPFSHDKAFSKMTERDV